MTFSKTNRAIKPKFLEFEENALYTEEVLISFEDLKVLNKKGIKDLLKLRQKIRKELKIEDKEEEEESEGESEEELDSDEEEEKEMDKEELAMAKEELQVCYYSYSQYALILSDF